MEILEIYKKYQIMPQLAEHQFKVAAVGFFISDCLIEAGVFSEKEKREVVSACLLHDMGNIIKFDFSKTKTFLNLQLDFNHWEKVKADFIEKYGKDEHVGTIEIIRELGVGPRIVELVDAVGFNQAESNLQSGDLSKQICAYADMRVTPKGVRSLEERFEDLRVRYESKRIEVGGGEEERISFEDNLRKIEKEIFLKAGISPEAVSEESLKPIVLELSKYQI